MDKKATTNYALIIGGYKVNMPEPRQTLNMSYSQIMDVLEKMFKKGSSGKEYNLVTKYAIAITKSIFGDSDPIYPVLIDFSNVRKEWIKASIHFQKKGIVEDKGIFGGLIIKKPKNG